MIADPRHGMAVLFSWSELFNRVIRIKPLKTGKISDNVYAVKTETVNFFIYRDGESTICIDSGYGPSRILRELDSLNVDPGSVTHLFLTHSDFDHADGLPAFTRARVYLSADEEQMITRQRTRMWGLVYNREIKGPYDLLRDNDVITAGSITVRAIATPGHTPGSMSYLVNESDLFVGDAFRLEGDSVYPQRRYIVSMDSEGQKRSIRKLAGLDRVRLLCTAHTGYTKAFNAAASHLK